MPDPAVALAVRLSYDRPPGSAVAFIGALADRRPGRLPRGDTSPRIEGSIADLRWSDALLRRYRRVCGFDETSPLPLPFPHIVGSGLHLRMLLRPEFPVRLPGLVHVWHRIRQSASVEASDALSMKCWIEGHREVDAGAEFCLHTSVSSGEAVVWEEQTGFIARAERRKGSGGRSSDRGRETEMTATEVARIDAPAEIGRRYARASGDYNPIHLSAATARPFGFPRAIAHGMWTMARCVAQLGRSDEQSSSEVFVQFKRPVFLPSMLSLEACRQDTDGTAFRVVDSKSGAVCLTGQLGGTVQVGGDATG